MIQRREDVVRRVSHARGSGQPQAGAIQTAAYGQKYPDGKGRLARVCVTAAGRHYRTGAW
jgi:hypothetical protein